MFRSSHFTRIVAIVLAFVLMVSCKKEEKIPLTSMGETLVGAWVLHDISAAGLYEYQKTQGLATDKPGWIFKANGTLVDRKNQSFCGFGPIEYQDYEGKWNESSDTTLRLDTWYWGGRQEYAVELVLVTTDKLLVRIKY